MISDVFFVLGSCAVLLSIVMFYIADEKLSSGEEGGKGYVKRAVYTISIGGAFFILSYLFAILS